MYKNYKQGNGGGIQDGDFVANTCRWGVLQTGSTPYETGLCTSFASYYENTTQFPYIFTAIGPSTVDPSGMVGEGFGAVACSDVDAMNKKIPGAPYCCKVNTTLPKCDGYAGSSNDSVGVCSGSPGQCRDDEHLFDEVACKDYTDANGSVCTWTPSFTCDDDSCETVCDTYCGENSYCEYTTQGQCSAYSTNVTACDTEDLGCGWSCVDATPEPS